eukprot:CAMPEP_0116021456 /NCGR_PEP_ID=MMETSP0321-20121206/10400_1 /TAXON_ID=163516 /ORGANISM="Leptocylindrus danicus var. danicus, Strain B650" /LENGTH=62 /DNA_ID=CAMNT_0003492335 /DNA_START=40 /DNA_END=228 /DNA_ORIENTATION=-
MGNGDVVVGACACSWYAVTAANYHLSRDFTASSSMMMMRAQKVVTYASPYERRAYSESFYRL